MKLEECKFGVIVQQINPTIIGMIVGISENSVKEAIPLVQWQDGKQYAIHHSNIKLVKEEHS